MVMWVSGIELSASEEQVMDILVESERRIGTCLFDYEVRHRIF